MLGSFLPYFRKDLKAFATKLGIVLSDDQIEAYESQFEKNGDFVDLISTMIKYLRRKVFVIAILIEVFLVMTSYVLYVKSQQ